MKTPRLAALLLSAIALFPGVRGQTFLEIRQNQTLYNLQSQGGVPISQVVNDPAGSNGKQPTVPQQNGAGLTVNPATAWQFRSMVSYGALAAPDPQKVGSLDPGKSLVGNAEAIGLPSGSSPSIKLVLSSAKVGAPFLSRQLDFLFGSVIPVPDTDEKGALLPSNVQKENYWLPEPYTTDNHASDRFYFSPHAGRVYAIQPGPIQVVWKRAVPYTSEPADYSANPALYQKDGNNYYPLFTKRYVVSGSAVKEPRQIYWTEKSFSRTGKPVQVPSALVDAVQVVYNSAFLERVASEFKPLGEVPLIPSSTPQLQETRTLWFDSQQNLINAYNAEGRAFVEFLGDKVNGENRRPLGFEIVDVIRQPNPNDIRIELGEKITPYQDAEDVNLYPEPIVTGTGKDFIYRKPPSGGADRPDVYAIRETSNQNDVLVLWLKKGILDLKWPYLLGRYELRWPVEAEKYSHYVRPVGTEQDALATAITLPAENVPQIDYQDPFDQPRAKITPDFKFYSFLNSTYPAHRTLLRFTSGDFVRFERVFSWLDTNLKNNTFAGTVATSLTDWNATDQKLHLPDDLTAPRVIDQTVFVGQRIAAPPLEAGSGVNTPYIAGYINQQIGTAYSVSAYIDPFAKGFEEANKGAIIPVNAIPQSAVPNKNKLEVLWFRANSVDTTAGFKTVLWPAALGRYTTEWPPSPDEIILASNDGSGALPSIQAKGHIYFQNDATKQGYNPNEEHALMLGGQAYALRDDLNIVAGTGYSSEPFVLLEYTETDGRPMIHPFRVVRERPGVTFTYNITAGLVVQPPMPLPLLDKPFAPKLPGVPLKNLDVELSLWTVAASTVSSAGGLQASTLTLGTKPIFPDHRWFALQSGSTVKALFVTSVNYQANSLQGVVSLTTPFTLSAWTLSAQPANPNQWKHAITGGTAGVLQDKVVLIAAPDQRLNWPGTVKEIGEESGVKYVVVEYASGRPAEAEMASVLVNPQGNLAANDLNGWELSSEPVPGAIVNPTMRSAYSQFTFQDRKGDRWVYRGPHGTSWQPALFAQFYYRTMDGFYFPGQPQPPIGTITPYLRAKDSSGAYLGDPVKGNLDNDQNGDGNPLGITYQPVWPESVPVLQMAETLMVPKRGLPAVRGQSSLSVYYQQSIAGGGESQRSVVLHDATREKAFELGAVRDSNGTLGKIPDSVRSSSSRGKTFFPNLPPHLLDRFFLDPNRGKNGALVFKGQFVDEPVGEKYVLLNVLGTKDLAALKALCLSTDPVKQAWDLAINGLTTRMEEFRENPAKPGTFIAQSNPSVKAAADLAEIANENIAVDSYALSALGPGTGYVTLVAGNGLAFTPISDPVSVQIIRVVKDLYRGELKIVKSSNPLSEKLTMQQVTDLAGQIDQYDFDWRIAAPVDGVPPLVTQNTPRVLMGNGTWGHIVFPVHSDTAGASHLTANTRVAHDVSTTVVAVNMLSLPPATAADAKFEFLIPGGHRLVEGNQVQLRNAEGDQLPGLVVAGTTPTRLLVKISDSDANNNPSFLATGLDETLVPGERQGIVFRTFTTPAGVEYSDLWLSMNLDAALGARVYVDGQPVVTANLDGENSIASTAPGDLAPLENAYRLDSGVLAGGTPDGTGNILHRVAVELYSGALPNVVQAFDVRIEAHESLDLAGGAGSPWLPLAPTQFEDGVRAIMGEGADIRALSDNYLIMRYRAKNSSHASFVSGGGWSRWTEPQLAEGWIKRVLAGINPFNQRVTDLFNNRVNTDANILTTAGQRWEGDVALNLDSINNYGLIEIYETILRRGRSLSIDAGINYGPANDALLLAAGYLNDLYLLVGNEAWADAANPTIAVGKTLSDVATALFAFKGQMASLLDEELALIRGRDDFMQPGVETAPAYNRLYWNYTRGIDAGEVVYALNYNIQPDPSKPPTGAITAADAQHMFPQGHGDAYGHYLTALKGYYSLLMSSDFSWVPRSEAVTILGKPVQVDYQDERKFAAAATALARAGKQALDLTWRSDYLPGHGNGWDHLAPTRVNSTRQITTTRYWGTDHWASRSGQGTYINWVIGNALLPAVDPDPTHEGIQKIDRTTVPELRELPALGEDIQTSLDNAEGGLSPLGLPEDGIAFDINPNRVFGASPATHFEQVYERAYQTLVNAASSFNDAKEVTKAIRNEQDALTDLQTAVDKQELAYQNQLIELYGTPYPDDIGPGRTYVSGYTGPDLVHYMYVEDTDLASSKLQNPQQSFTFKLDVQQVPSDWWSGLSRTFDFVVQRSSDSYKADQQYISYELGPRGFVDKPSTWTGRRASPGTLQQTIADLLNAHDALRLSLIDMEDQKRNLDKQIQFFDQKVATRAGVQGFKGALFTAQTIWDAIKTGLEIKSKALGLVATVIQNKATAIGDGIPKVVIAGVAVGTDAPGKIGETTVKTFGQVARETIEGEVLVTDSYVKIAQLAVDKVIKGLETFAIPELEWDRDLKDMTIKLGDALYAERTKLANVNLKLRALEAAQRKYRGDTAKGDRVQAERETFRLRSAAVIQGYRTRDAAFRIFRNEKLERYKSLFDLASRYSLLAANAYDYETGLLNTEQGKQFVRRIVSSRALGVVKDGAPQFAGSDTGDPGLSSALAEMKADWDVLKGRLGFNNPDSYGTTVSLRTENLRILSGADGDHKWRDMLQNSRMANLLDDQDVRRYCLQIDPGSGLPVPGLVITFSTSIADFYNLFGKQLAGGDHAFTPSTFATKIFAVGVALEGYKGMDDPGATSSTTSQSGGTSPADPSAPFLDPDTLAATPYVYLIPVGTDSMRSPPLGDESQIRTWNVSDVSIPLPFNIGESDFSTKPLWQSSESLTEALFSERKHQAFRPVSSAKSFPNAGAVFQRTQFMNARLIGRSVWNSQWKLVIPGQTLLNNPNEGLDRLIRTVKDVKLHFQTYSYSGN